MTARAVFTTEFITERLFDQLARKRFGALDGQSWLGLHEPLVDDALDGYTDSLRRLAHAYYLRGEMTAAHFFDAREALYGQVEEKLSAATRRPRELRAVWNLARLRRFWPSFPPEEQRRLLTAEIAYVTINPANQRGRFVDTTRFEITWREDLIAAQRATAWVTSAEAATVLRVPRSALTRLVKTGDLRPEKLGRGWVFERREIDRLTVTLRTRAGESAPPARRPHNASPYRRTSPKRRPVSDRSARASR